MPQAANTAGRTRPGAVTEQASLKSLQDEAERLARAIAVDHVPPDAGAIARIRQVIREAWVHGSRNSAREAGEDIAAHLEEIQIITDAMRDGGYLV